MEGLKTVTFRDGKVNCNIHGVITGYDCQSLRGRSCGSCGIHEALGSDEDDESVLIANELDAIIND